MGGSTIAVIVVLIVLLAFLIFSYNKFVTLRQRVLNSWSQIDVQLKRRYDLIPNLVETVKTYAVHEQTTLENVTNARTQAMNAGQVTEQAGAENMLTSMLRSLFAVAENYPDLKADENFRQLQAELVETENKISFARQFYNDTVQRYNIAIEQFPWNVMAGVFSFSSADYFQIEESSGARQVVGVKFHE